VAEFMKRVTLIRTSQKDNEIGVEKEATVIIIRNNKRGHATNMSPILLQMTKLRIGIRLTARKNYHPCHPGPPTAVGDLLQGFFGGNGLQSIGQKYQRHVTFAGRLVAFPQIMHQILNQVQDDKKLFIIF